MTDTPQFAARGTPAEVEGGLAFQPRFDADGLIPAIVTDAATGLPLAGAQVGFPELALFTLANGAGVAQIVRIPPGMRTLEVSMLGYGKASTTMMLEAHAVATGEVGLTADPIEIEGLIVTASAQIQRLRDTGFYQRERMGIGHQVGPLEIASTVALQTADLFSMVPSVVVRAGPLARSTWRASARA